MQSQYKVFISAAEASSDAHGAALVRALKNALPPHCSLEIRGMGGPCLQKEGLRAIVDGRQLSVMGFTEILGRIPKIFQALNQLRRDIEKNPPDLAVLIDYPDFHFRLARHLKKQRIPSVYYIPPKVWVWRKKRVEFLRQYFAKILCIFPFEREFYQNHDLPVRYVGNPLFDELPLQSSRAEARKALGISEKEKVLVLMVGSRPTEIARHLKIFLQAAHLAVHRLREKGSLGSQERLRILLPLPPSENLRRVQELISRSEEGFDFSKTFDLSVSQGNSAQCLLAADFGLIKSGTSTLEAALLQCPHVLVYKPSLITSWIFQYLIRYKGPVGLPNLILGRKKKNEFILPEILNQEVQVEVLSDFVFRAFTDLSFVHGLKRELEQVLSKMTSLEARGPSQAAADEILEMMGAATP